MQRRLTFAVVAAAALSWPAGLSAQPAREAPADDAEDAPEAEAPEEPQPAEDEPGDPEAPDPGAAGGDAPEGPADTEAPAEAEPPERGGADAPQPPEEGAAPAGDAPAGDAAGPAPGTGAGQPLPPPGRMPPGGARPSGGPGGQLPGGPSGAQQRGPGAQQPQGPVGLFPEPGADATQLRNQGERKTDGEGEAPREDRIFAEDWWSHARPVFEIHGYFRTRAELFHNFSLDRVDPPNSALWPRPADDQYQAYVGGTPEEEYGPRLCTPDETSASNLDSDNPAAGTLPCRNKTNAGANIRFRLNPELHISDNVRVVSQIDLLDNATLGSTPSGASYVPSNDGGYEVVNRSGFTPVGTLDDTIVPPQSGVNSIQDSINVKRAWGEYATPMGELRFGRMPNHWGLGMLHNAGDKFDDDFQSTVDRIMFITGVKPLDLYVGGMWDFPNEGPISQTLPGGQPYDVAQLDDVNQWGLVVMRKKSPQLIKQALANEEIVLNGGAYVLLRKQLLANDFSGGTADAAAGANVPNATPADQTRGFSRRGALIWIPDLWFQLRYKKFRFEAEWAAILGNIESVDTDPGVPIAAGSDAARTLRQFGVATEMEQLLVEDRLHLNFKAGWASGDPDAFDPGNVANLAPGRAQAQVNDDTSSTFRFHPNYRIDLILHRYILNRVQGTYYFRPEVAYDFMRKPSGQRMGGGAGFTWARASELVQTPGHARDLGIELNAKLYFQSKDGSLNDDLDHMGGFYSMLQYGVLFPLAGLGYQSQEADLMGGAADTSAAQILRWYMGILF